MKKNVIEEFARVATDGYNAPATEDCPYYQISSYGIAWRLGRHFRETGRTKPRDVWPGRGYLIHANDMLFDSDKGFDRIR